MTETINERANREALELIERAIVHYARRYPTLFTKVYEEYVIGRREAITKTPPTSS